MNRESLAKFVFGFSGVLCYIKLAKNAGFSECLFLCCLKIAKKNNKTNTLFLLRIEQESYVCTLWSEASFCNQEGRTEEYIVSSRDVFSDKK